MSADYIAIVTALKKISPDQRQAIVLYHLVGLSVNEICRETGAPAGSTTLQLGPLILRVPGTWRITYHDAQGDDTVSTGSCAGSDLMGAELGSSCPAFSLITEVGPSTRTADYTVWPFGGQEKPGVTSFSFQQRDWYLPQSRILVVDEYEIPSLAQVLAAATWAG